MIRASECVAVEVKILNETEKAFLVTRDKRSNAEWVAKSMVEVEDLHAIREAHVMRMPEWLAIRAGLV